MSIDKVKAENSARVMDNLAIVYWSADSYRTGLFSPISTPADSVPLNTIVAPWRRDPQLLDIPDSHITFSIAYISLYLFLSLYIDGPAFRIM